MSAERFLVVNADDLGLTPGVNRGILEAHTHGIVTSASLMVRQAAAAEVASLVRGNNQLAIGLHVDLGEWSYVAGEWRPVYEFVSTSDKRAVRQEVEYQLARFRELLGREPTHLDSHQHVHRHEPLRSILIEEAQSRRIPLRHFHRSIRYCGEFYGQSNKGSAASAAIEVEALLKLIDELPPGWTELACHPGYSGDLHSTYGRERDVERRTLCHPAVRTALSAQGIQLRAFASVSWPQSELEGLSRR